MVINPTYLSPNSMPVPHKPYFSPLLTICPFVNILFTHADLGLPLTWLYCPGEIRHRAIHTTLKQNIRICINQEMETLPHQEPSKSGGDGLL